MALPCSLAFVLCHPMDLLGSSGTKLPLWRGLGALSPGTGAGCIRLMERQTPGRSQRLKVQDSVLGCQCLIVSLVLSFLPRK